MAAKTLEAKLKSALDFVYIDVAMIRDGKALGPVGERLDFMRSNLDDAIEIQKRIEKRDARLAMGRV